MRDHDAEKHFLEQIHYVMSKCTYRDDVRGIGVCSLNVAPCEHVLHKGQCEAVADYFQEKGGERDDE